ncbi:MAG: hypothetical protein R2788_06110 [Saprospiraceae bacterium]
MRDLGSGVNVSLRNTINKVGERSLLHFTCEKHWPPLAVMPTPTPTACGTI